MGQVLSNLLTILFGRKKKAETSDEENVYHSLADRQEVKPLIHPNSSYGNSRVSEKDEGSVAIIVDSSVEVVEKIKHILNVSTGEKIRVPKDGSGSKAKKGGVLQKERRIKHYCSSHKILLVGEGDFSFSACLANVFGSADNMVATSLNSEGFLQKNYGKAMSNISDLKSRGCMVLHGVDATNMSGHKILKSMRFDRIVFNFPHAGFCNKESRETQISRHQKLITLFFKNAKKMLCEEGEIHISHKSVGFHLKWNIESLASLNGLTFTKAVVFNLSNYPGYNTKYGFGGDGNFDCNPSKTYVWTVIETMDDEEYTQ